MLCYAVVVGILFIGDCSLESPDHLLLSILLYITRPSMTPNQNHRTIILIHQYLPSLTYKIKQPFGADAEYNSLFAKMSEKEREKERERERTYVDM